MRFGLIIVNKVLLHIGRVRDRSILIRSGMMRSAGSDIRGISGQMRMMPNGKRQFFVNRWPNGKIPYTVDASFGTALSHFDKRINNSHIGDQLIDSFRSKRTSDYRSGNARVSKKDLYSFCASN